MQSNKAKLTVTGVGAGWSDPVEIRGIGRDGEITLLGVRGDVGDATTAAAMDLLIFEADKPADGSYAYTAGGLVPVATLDPATIADDDRVLLMTGVNVAPSATAWSDLARPDELFTRSSKQALYLAVANVTGDVHITLRAKTEPA